MKYVKVSAKVERRIETLRQSDKAGKAIAKKAGKIIEDLRSGAILVHMEPSGSFTKYGEKRIKNCRKYDIGCGYRLITLQKGLTIFIPFLGTHDKCQRWLENNSRLKEIAPGKGVVFSVSEKKQMVKKTSNDHISKYYWDEVLINLSGQDLRNVFFALVEGAKKRKK